MTMGRRGEEDCAPVALKEGFFGLTGTSESSSPTLEIDDLP
jgi:hypothetical protein